MDGCREEQMSIVVRNGKERMDFHLEADYVYLSADFFQMSCSSQVQFGLFNDLGWSGDVYSSRSFLASAIFSMDFASFHQFMTGRLDFFRRLYPV